MNIIKRVATLCVVPVLLSACVNHTWAPPPSGSAISYDQQAAQCRLLARGITPSGGFVAAAGKPAFVGAFVGASVLASAIAGAVKLNENFNDCMFASGWQAVEPR
jgi:hypothetical protein